MPKYKIHWTEIRQVTYKTEVTAPTKIRAQKMLFEDPASLRPTTGKCGDIFDYISEIKIEEIT
jgi:hypothetical protein